MTPPSRDRLRGILLGLATGEALGAPAEFLSAEQIAGRYGVITEMLGGGCHQLEPGETTDATDMMLCLAECMIAEGRFRAEQVMERYYHWFEGQPRDVSLTVRTVMLSHRAGTPWDLASRRAYEILGQPTAGNGSLMRCAPIAVRYADDPAERRSASLDDSALTHFDRLAGWCCAAFNDLLVAAAHDQLVASVHDIADAFRDEDRRVSVGLREALDAEPEEIQCSAFVLDSLKAALWAVTRSASFEEAVCLVVNMGNDADTVGAITGALAGAVHGESGIPERWLTRLGLRTQVAAATDRLADAAGTG